MMGERHPQKQLWSYQVNLDKRVRSDHLLRRITEALDLDFVRREVANFAVPTGTFGGVIPTPALDRVAKAGLRYTQFHSTALCSPTRAALITGRNHHTVGFGIIGELSTGYPGYDSIIGPQNATIGTILRDNGYATSWFGKDHNTPTYQYSVAG